MRLCVGSVSRGSGGLRFLRFCAGGPAAVVLVPRRLSFYLARRLALLPPPAAFVLISPRNLSLLMRRWLFFILVSRVSILFSCLAIFICPVGFLFLFPRGFLFLFSPVAYIRPGGFLFYSAAFVFIPPGGCIFYFPGGFLFRSPCRRLLYFPRRLSIFAFRRFRRSLLCVFRMQIPSASAFGIRSFYLLLPTPPGAED